jgi:hypothetical protein
LHSGIHLGHGIDDVEGKLAHSSRNGARHVSRTNLSRELCDAGGVIGRRTCGNCFRIAGMDAYVDTGSIPR